jgi:hypothetical protein
MDSECQYTRTVRASESSFPGDGEVQHPPQARKICVQVAKSTSKIFAAVGTA